MSLVFIRSLHYKRVPNYSGWWTQILNRAKDPIIQSIKTKIPAETRVPLQIPFAEVIEPTQPIEKPTAEAPKIYYLKGKPVEIPLKPDAPDNCCMSGCAHCVWDMYQEDMEEYAQKKKELKDRFIEAGAPIPIELDPSKTVDVLEEMDPTMKAFLEMEKKMKNM